MRAGGAVGREMGGSDCGFSVIGGSLKCRTLELTWRQQDIRQIVSARRWVRGDFTH